MEKNKSTTFLPVRILVPGNALHTNETVRPMQRFGCSLYYYYCYDGDKYYRFVSLNKVIQLSYHFLFLL